MTIDQKGSHKKLIIGISIAVLTAAGLAFYLLGGIEKVRAAFQPKNQEQTITVTGKIACLPRKDGGETSALSCALGMQSDDGKYYGLSGGSQNTELSDAAGSDKHVKLSGKLRTSSDATYEMKAIIAVDTYSFTN
jgi:hypothetical protein